ncbi:MAG: PAS domain S-box protein [Deltaproteobacteria bacterium]|nr:PAS domain S-box protein [Deltaproteobacteria bacterium]MBT4637253.1 PAS domain S-box protein [Deltaproteobacteria bacterium]MBT6614247.1 PAS domain S-box protein [Deltaproteobacteria bacterium]
MDSKVKLKEQLIKYFKTQDKVLKWPDDVFDLCTDGIGRFSIEPGVSVTVPAKEQIDLICKNSSLFQCNEVFADGYGFKKTPEIFNKKFFTEVIQLTPQMVKILESFVITGYRVVKSEITNELPDGTKKYLLCSAIGIVELSTLTGMWIINNDVTDTRHNQSLIIKSEKKYHDFYENAPDIFLSVSAKTGKIIECNRTATETLGEIVGKQIFDIYTPESAIYARKTIFPEFVKTGYIDGAELQLQKRDGGIIDVLLKVSAIRDTKGNILQSRSILRDITKRKRTEMALQKTLEEFENLVEVRTFELKSINKNLQKEIDESRKTVKKLLKTKIVSKK